MSGPNGTGELPARVQVAVVGAGFSGIAAAAQLLRTGCTDLVLLERADAVGGTWRDNSYPGCACDVPSNLYSFSFAPEPGWTRSFAPWNEIRDYLERCVDRFGLRPHLHLSTPVTRSAWDDERDVWVLDTPRGRVEAEVLVAGFGPLAEPALPDVPGLGSFAGPVFHTARWDHTVDLRGRRVAVVGSGASAVQVAPAIAPEVERLLVLQRTPPWVLPRRDRARPEWERELYRRAPVVQRAARRLTYLRREGDLPAFLRAGLTHRLAERMALGHLAKQVPDPGLRAALTPHYALGCKRVLLSDDWYPALQRPNVDVVAAGLAEVREHSIVDTLGGEHEVDVLVLATGFHVTDLPAAETMFGRGGVSLAKTWQGSPSAYDGMTVAGFPNLFLLLGPATGLGHSSVVLMAEAQAGYVAGAVRTRARLGTRVTEVGRAAQESYDADVQRRLERTTWTTGGCRSWYQDANGRVSAIWPRGVGAYRRLVRRFDPSPYLLSRPGDAGVAHALAAVPQPPESAAVVRAPVPRPMLVMTDDGVALQVEVSGPQREAGATLVLVHGWTLDVRLWDDVVDRLVGTAPGLRVVAYDARDHGRSGTGDPSARTLQQLAADLGQVLAATAPDGPVVLAGHSMGGMTLMAYAEADPGLLGGRVAGAAFVSTSAGHLGGRVDRAVSAGLAAGRRAESAGRRRPNIPHVERLAFGAGARPRQVALTAQMWRHTSAAATADLYAELLRHDRRPALAAYTGIRTAVLVGSKDLLTPPSHAAAIARALPGADLVVLGGAGHMLPFERPAEVATALAVLAVPQK